MFSSRMRTQGMNFDLETDEEVSRAKALMEKNPHKYEVSSLRRDGSESPKPRLYYMANPGEGKSIHEWVRSGEGEEPFSDIDLKRL